ncbi:hypothetical protein G7054_g11854 [Neopestalotiopsis clavispora]|nr:hypothetical protein G7054_g11854 [Neopestalotiopsis clavispora]
MQSEKATRSWPQPAAQPYQIDVNKEPTQRRTDDDSIPDGGHGWVVLTGCTIVAFSSIGTAQSWGVYQSALLAADVSSSINLLFVGSLSTGIVSAFAILYSLLTRLVGPRKTGMAGILLMSLSGAISGIVYTDIRALFVSYGVIMGVGMGLTFTTVAVAPTQYFLKKRGLANGIVFAGGGLGGAVISYSMEALIQHIGIPWAFRVHCLLIATTGLPAAYLIRERVPYQPAKLVEWSMFKSPVFVLLFLTGFIALFPLFVPPFCIVLFSQSIGLSSTVGAGLVAGFNLSSAVGRIASGFLCDILGPLNVLLMTLLLLGLTMLLVWPFSTTLGLAILFVVLSGVFVGAFFSTMPTVVGHTFGSVKMSVTMGMILTGWTGGYVMGSPIAGYIIDANGGYDEGILSYRPAMYYAGSFALVAAGLAAAARHRISKGIKTDLLP